MDCNRIFVTVSVKSIVSNLKEITDFKRFHVAQNEAGGTFVPPARLICRLI